MEKKFYIILLYISTMATISNQQNRFIPERCVISKLRKRTEVEPYDYTFIAQILLRQKLICSASIIHNCWLLSAASCFDLSPDWSLYTMRIGVIGQIETFSTYPILQVYFQDEYIRYSNEHNIVLIRVDYVEDIYYLTSINLVSMKMNYYNVSDCAILGYKNYDDPIKSTELHEIKMEAINSTDCQHKINELKKKNRGYKPRTIGESNFCLIPITNLSETLCEVAIGGPALCSSSEKLRGVVVEFPWDRRCELNGPIPVIDIGTESEWLTESLLNLNRYVLLPSSSDLKVFPLNYWMTIINLIIITCVS